MHGGEKRRGDLAQRGSHEPTLNTLLNLWMAQLDVGIGIDLLSSISIHQGPQESYRESKLGVEEGEAEQDFVRPLWSVGLSISPLLLFLLFDILFFIFRK